MEIVNSIIAPLRRFAQGNEQEADHYNIKVDEISGRMSSKNIEDSVKTAITANREIKKIEACKGSFRNRIRSLLARILGIHTNFSRAQQNFQGIREASLHMAGESFLDTAQAIRKELDALRSEASTITDEEQSTRYVALTAEMQELYDVVYAVRNGEDQEEHINELFDNIMRDIQEIEKQYVLEYSLIESESSSDEETSVSGDIPSIPGAQGQQGVSRMDFSLPKTGIAQGVGHNTCYLASGLQVIASIPKMRDAFDATKNPIEGDAQKIEIQKEVKKILDHVHGSSEAYRDVDNLRGMLFAARVIDDRDAQLDSGALVLNLYEYMTGNGIDKALRFVERYEIDVEGATEKVFSEDSIRKNEQIRDDGYDEKYSTAEDLRERDVADLQPFTLNVKGDRKEYKGDNELRALERLEIDSAGEEAVPFEALFQGMMKEEVIDQINFNVEEDGRIVSKVSTATKIIALSPNQVWPDVLPVKVDLDHIIVEEMDDGGKKVIRNPDHGDIVIAQLDNPEGLIRKRLSAVNAPKQWSPPGQEGVSYSLRAVIRHRGEQRNSESRGHYYAFIRGKDADGRDRYVEANDESVTSSGRKLSDDAKHGVMFFYVKNP
jgi:hypothetical protein